MRGTKDALDDPISLEDEKFDRLYPAPFRKLSSLFWTPVAIAAEAGRLLASKPESRVLDIGCGVGKFCLVAASLADGHYTGIEQRKPFVEAARAAAHTLALPEVEFIHGNILDHSFASYDAFYLFNPFEENMHGHKIDSAIPLSAELFRKYTRYVSEQLGLRPLGTRVVTYMGYADDIPACYDCEATLFGDDVKLWIKNRDYDADAERLSLRPSRSYRGSQGWVEPRVR